MCAIIGIVSLQPVQNRGWLRVGRDAMSHRGPDDAGEWWSADGRAGLGHRRLSILDLTAAGHQPMSTELPKPLCVVFNGEIYNFRELRRELEPLGHSFKTGTDTEVILRAYAEWGVRCLARLEGMFSLALYDEDGGHLLLARDRAGEKPLFYSLSGGQLRFSSELKGVLADPSFDREIDQTGLDCFLSFGYVPGTLSILKGANKVAPGTAVTFSMATGVLTSSQYWALPEYRADLGDLSEEGLVAELEGLLEGAVRRQMVSDVPVGVLLSGGVDSSLVATMAARSTSRLRTFSVSFPGHAAHDESKHARLVADWLGTDHLELAAGSLSPDDLPLLAAQFDEPIADSSMLPTYVLSKAVRQHCTVALGGDGGDELFGGYETYRRLLHLAEAATFVPKGVRKVVAFGAREYLPTGFRGRNWLEAWAADLEQGLPLISTLFNWKERYKLTGYRRADLAVGIRTARVPMAKGIVERATRMDFANYLPEDILVKVDRASMLASLEVRSPFLDRRVVEFAFSKVPLSMKVNSRERKILLKKLAGRLLPPQFNASRKQGFSIPLATWLSGGPWRELVNDVLLDSRCTFDRSYIKELIYGLDRGRANAERLFALTLFELWRRNYMIDAPVVPNPANKRSSP